MLSYFKPIDNRVIINSNVKNSTFWVQKGCDILHNNRSDTIVNDISEIFKFMMSILYDW